MAVTENAIGEQISTGIPNMRFHEIIFICMYNNKQMHICRLK